MYSKKSLTITGVVIAVLMVIFAFTDLGISKAIFDIESPYGKFFEAVGEFPATVIGALSLGILFFNLKSTGVKGIIFKLLCGFFMIMSAFMGGFMMMHYLVDGFTVWNAIIPIILGACAILAGLKVKSLSPERREAFRRVACVGLWLFVLAMVLINIIKPIWGRVRFREMKEPFDMFTAWFIPQFNRFSAYEDPKSFPSGHTGNSAVIFVITLLPLLFDKLKDKKVLFTVIAFAWTFMVAISRIIMGAHFASDVTMGGTITFVCFILLCKAFKVDSKSV